MLYNNWMINKIKFNSIRYLVFIVVYDFHITEVVIGYKYNY